MFRPQEGDRAARRRLKKYEISRRSRRLSQRALSHVPETFAMRLECGKCGHVDRYELRQIAVSPGQQGTGVSRGPVEESLSFLDYFRCNQCGSGWPWKLTRQAHAVLLALFAGHVAGAEDPRLVVTEARLFDGTPARSSAYAEDYLLGILEREPGNSFVWDRLGNLYRKAGLEEKAIQAFARALAADPKNIEAHYTMGHLLLDENRPAEAAKHFHTIVRFAREYTHLPREKLREVVHEVLGLLGGISQDSEGEIPMLPPPAPRPRAGTGEPGVAYLTELDLREESDRQRLVSMVLGESPRPRRDDHQPDRLLSPRKRGVRQGSPIGTAASERIEDKYLDVLQDLEFAIAEAHGEHPEMSDYSVMRALEALLDVYAAEGIGRSPRGFNLSELERGLVEQLREVCEWRLGRGEPPTGQASEGDDEETPPISREEVMLCLKRIAKSVKRWNKDGGTQGYLTFIGEFFE